MFFNCFLARPDLSKQGRSGRASVLLLGQGGADGGQDGARHRVGLEHAVEGGEEIRAVITSGI